ncbi:MAG: NUDIX domain-containing protein [Candidatus Pacebacteria bacterium]|nr:NUDIX domain-containing protein [Candidatus Paceibacterota bacterium]MDP7159459.1 NUDIX domain-containing protein [Candidatus Paceibacterota bacterium]MDP7365961.1 NUDIX domain-containing protein [Candidatus Paceibacterota bacterium]MDP7466246.1 NUDIX domain-containing protein [Candidatus Paceibacterota bacterium]MDP7648336.1 NUDIX domain-containing protein [Candidatus Paceibacterota bacterium]
MNNAETLTNIGRDYAVFGIISDYQDGKIPLIQEKEESEKKLWKLPGGRPKAMDNHSPERTVMREISDEVDVIIYEPTEKDVLFIKHLDSHDFVVFKADYYSGALKPKKEIERVETFSPDEIKKMIAKRDIVQNHAEGLTEYFVDFGDKP